MSNGFSLESFRHILMGSNLEDDPDDRFLRRRKVLVWTDVGLTTFVFCIIAFSANLLISGGGVPESLPNGEIADEGDLDYGHGEFANKMLDFSRLSGGSSVHEHYYCALHPEFISDHPGTCPICGNALLPPGGSGSLFIDMHANAAFGVARAKRVRLYDSGWVDRLAVKRSGVMVDKGALLAEFYSPELRGQKDNELGILRLFSPVSGMVYSIDTAEDKFVVRGATVVEILDGESLWYRVEYLYKEHPELKPGLRVEARLPGKSNVVSIGDVNDIEAHESDSSMAVAWLRFEPVPELNGISSIDARIFSHSGAVLN